MYIKIMSPFKEPVYKKLSRKGYEFQIPDSLLTYKFLFINLSSKEVSKNFGILSPTVESEILRFWYKWVTDH